MLGLSAHKKNLLCSLKNIWLI